MPELQTVRPREIHDVLVNPGMGFMTFQRFNGDSLNEGTGWTEGYPIEYQPFHGSFRAELYPDTSLAYFRVYWRFIEPASGDYRWDLIDRALHTAAERGQTLLLRIAPYGTGGDNDVPDWYRALVGPELNQVGNVRANPEDPRYVEHFTRLIREMGARYNGHPLLESVDLSITGPWGEGEGSDRLSPTVRESLVDAYLDSFPDTHLLMMLTDVATNGYGISKRPVGWRADCLGDVGGFSSTWCHMYDAYPRQIIECHLSDAWKQAPVSFEVCWVMQHWKDKGWDIDAIIDESLKWHISSFNPKSSPVPEEWWPHVNRWLTRMGYRFVLRKLTFPASVQPGGALDFTSWWENKGVAPCYRPFHVAFRLVGPAQTAVALTRQSVETWLPGDILCDGSIPIPADLPPGDYDLQIAVVDPVSTHPRIKLAIEGRLNDGWYPLGPVQVQPSSA